MPAATEGAGLVYAAAELAALATALLQGCGASSSCCCSSCVAVCRQGRGQAEQSGKCHQDPGCRGLQDGQQRGCCLRN